MNQLWIRQEGMMLHWPNPSSSLAKDQYWIGTHCCLHTQSIAG
jgi:hypothetical protein